jgi:tryptophanyl-tRNA synthetase
LQDIIKVDKKSVKSTLVSFKQYRETDGLFYFKLVDASANVLLQSRAFVTPKEAGVAIAKIKSQGIQQDDPSSVYLGTLTVAELNVINTALQQFVEN